jgi:phosphatidate cytidylyltransferase
MLRHRVISGIILGGALLAAVFLLPPAGVLPLLLLILWFAMREFYALLDAREVPHFKGVGIASGMVLVGASWWARQAGCPYPDAVEPALLFGACAAVFIRQLFHTRTNRPWDSVAGTLLGVLYVAFLFNFLAKLLSNWGDADGRMLVLFLAVVVKFTDIGAYFIGCAIGRRKLLPRVSPAKTWEGVIGGVAVGMAAGWAMSLLAGERLPIRGVSVWTVGFLLAAAGVLGDLIESQFKRASGVKDSGAMIQGMGGLLDVIDSLLFAAPVLYIAALFVVPH